MILSPETTHIGHRIFIGDEELGTVLCYGHYTDDQQAVMLLLPEKVRDLKEGNYGTCFLSRKGEIDDFRSWMNLHDASNHMQQHMGQDR